MKPNDLRRTLALLPERDTMHRILETMGRDELIEIVLDQREMIGELMEARDRDREAMEHLQARLEETEREAKRQAAPFRKPPHKRALNPGKPGRKPGHPGSYRRPPAEVDAEIEVPLAACPCCGEDLSGRPCEPVEQTIIDLPQVKPVVTRLVTYETTCPRCREGVQSNHPLKVSTATGAAGTHLGPNALAVLCTLNKELGLTMGKTCRTVERLFGLSITRGGLSQALDRIAGKLAPEYEDQVKDLRSSSVVHVDETSWWVGGPGHWLHVFATPDTTVYRVADNRSRRVLHEILGERFPGTLVSDCLNIYDDASPLQHKCYAHHSKAIVDAIPLSRDHTFLGDCRRLLHAAMALKAAKPSMPGDAFRTNRGILAILARDLLRSPRSDPLAERVRRRLAKQADHLFTFLDYEGVDATNNLAERQLRPAVIARKLSCGNKTASGARTWQILASIAATCAQRNLSFTRKITAAMLLTR